MMMMMMMMMNYSYTHTHTKFHTGFCTHRSLRGIQTVVITSHRITNEFIEIYMYMHMYVSIDLHIPRKSSPTVMVKN
jgi:hypothetical protein